MAQYTIRLLDAKGGQHGLLAQERESDVEVVGSAETLDHPHGLEVWEGPRLVARVPPISVWGMRLPL